MGEIVWAAASVHAPQLLTRPPSEDPAQLDADIAAMAELGALLDETKPDVLLILGIDHLETFFLGAVPMFAVVTGDRATASYAGHWCRSVGARSVSPMRPSPARTYPIPAIKYVLSVWTSLWWS